MTPPPKLEPGRPDDVYPVNEQGSDAFNVGGVRRTLPPQQQLEQLASYMEATYPLPDLTPPWSGGNGDPDPADRYAALLPDRLTHAAMLMLGSAVDHTMPGVAYLGGVTVEEAPGVSSTVFVPSEPTGHWAISLHPGGWWRGSGRALDHAWRPEVAAAAELSGTRIVDVDYPLAPHATVAEIREAVTRAIGYARHHSAASISVWGQGVGGALAALCAPLVDALVLTFPDFGSLEQLPEELRAGAELPAVDAWPRTLVQVASEDAERAGLPGLAGAASVEVREYWATRHFATPETHRQKLQDVAEFLRG